MKAIFATNPVGNYLHMLCDCSYMYVYNIVSLRKTTVKCSERSCYFTPCLNLYDTLYRNIRKTDMSVTYSAYQMLLNKWSRAPSAEVDIIIHAEISSAQLFLWSIQTRFAWNLKAVALVFFKQLYNTAKLSNYTIN